MTSLRIAFCDTHIEFDADAWIWTRLLRRHHAVDVVSPRDRPDVLFYGDWGSDHRSFDGRKIYWSGENMIPDFDQCDFALTSANLPSETRHLRVPTWRQVIGDPGRLLVSSPPDISEFQRRPGFCAQVVSNPKGLFRNRLFRRLGKRRPVSSGGRAFNNIGGPVADKRSFLRKHRFCLAIENSSSSGYVTEKLTDAFLAGCIPIYWGDPEVATDFNPRRFVNAHDFETLDDLCRRVLEVDDDPSLQASILNEPVFPDNSIPDHLRDETIAAGLAGFVAANTTPGPRRYRNRRLREHVHPSWFHQTAASWTCRADAFLWKLIPRSRVRIPDQ